MPESSKKGNEKITKRLQKRRKKSKSRVQKKRYIKSDKSTKEGSKIEEKKKSPKNATYKKWQKKT